jgi:hypothetical protein
MRGTVRVALVAAIGIVCVCLAPAHADRELPAMDPDRPVVCARATDGTVWRIQCDDASKSCLYAPDHERLAGGGRGKPLERARACPAFDEPFDRAAWEARGYTLVPAKPDVEWGWTRDDLGRAFQINFDLKRRMYFGVAYAPRKVLESPLESTRTSMDFGLLSYETWGGAEHPNRHRLRVVEGEVHLAPFTAEVVVLHYELSRRFLQPLVRITTFFGKPERHDLHFNLGLWSELGRMEVHRDGDGHTHLWRLGAAQVALDLWQSRNLDSFARIRTGMGVEAQNNELSLDGYRSALVAQSAFDLDWVLDPAGFHNLRLELSYEIPRYFEPLPGVGRAAHRARGKLLYEAIVLAINDQPLTFKLAAGGERRNDIPGVPDEWAFVLDAGLRFSLWAPPRPRP